MVTKMFFAPALAISTLGLSACSTHHGLEGAAIGAAAGAGVAAATGGDVAAYALAGAAAGGLVGYFVDKDGGCDGYNRDGYLDDDCFGTEGYPVDPR